MRDEELEALKLNYKKLVETIFVDELIPALFEKGILRSYDTIERIQHEKTTTDKACKLVHRIMKCDKPTAFTDFVDILKEQYEHLAKDLNQTVTKVRRQKRCLKRSNQSPKQRDLASPDSLEDVTPRGIYTRTLSTQNSTTQMLCYKCRRKVQSAISAEAGIPSLCFQARMDRKHAPPGFLNWQGSGTSLSESSMDDDTPLKQPLQMNEVTNRTQQVFYQAEPSNDEEFRKKSPFTLVTSSNNNTLDLTETVVKQMTSTNISGVSAGNAVENTDWHGLSVNYEVECQGDIVDGNHADLDHGICQCPAIFSTSESMPICRLVDYSFSEKGEDGPDTCPIDADTGEEIPLDDYLKEAKVYKSECKPVSKGDENETKNNMKDLCASSRLKKMEYTKEDNLLSTLIHQAMQQQGVKEIEGPNQSDCFRRCAIRKFAERNAVIFNISQDESMTEPTPNVAESRNRYITLTRSNFEESFGFKFVHGKMRPRFASDADYYITEIFANTCASACTDMRKGYTMLSVNGDTLEEKSLDEVIRLLTDSLTITLTLKPERSISRDICSYLA